MATATKKPRLSWIDEMRAESESRTADLRVISYGAGVQSTAMLLMALCGEIEPRPDCAIFADTGWEPRSVYETLHWVSALCQDLPLYVVSAGNIKTDILENGLRDRRFASMPFHVLNKKGEAAILRRQCTREYKIDPIEQKIRDLLGVAKGRHVKQSVESWQGISLDEMTRMRTNGRPWITNRYPLVEKRMTRRDCLRWLTERGHPLPHKSACMGCPFHDKHYYRELKRQSPDEFAEVVAFDEAIRTGHGLKGVDSPEAYVYRSMVPLAEVDLLTEEDYGQMYLFDEGMMDECEGMCGV